MIITWLLSGIYSLFVTLVASFAPSLRSGANDATQATNQLCAHQKSCDCPIYVMHKVTVSFLFKKYRIKFCDRPLKLDLFLFPLQAKWFYTREMSRLLEADFLRTPPHAMRNKQTKLNRAVAYVLIALLSDWLKIVVPLSQPIRSEVKSKRTIPQSHAFFCAWPPLWLYLSRSDCALVYLHLWLVKVDDFGFWFTLNKNCLKAKPGRA